MYTPTKRITTKALRALLREPIALEFAEKGTSELWDRLENILIDHPDITDREGVNILGVLCDIARELKIE